MSKTQIEKFIRFCEEQGIKVTKTRKGLMIRFPDGSSTVQHFTNSDVRAVPNQIARFRRAGMIHPEDKRPQTALPQYITDEAGGKVSLTTRKKITDYIIANDYPTVVYAGRVSKAAKIDPATTNRALYKMGFIPGTAVSVRPGRPWATPDDLLELRDKAPAMPSPLDIARRAKAAQEAVNDLGAGKPVEVENHVEGSAEEAERLLNESTVAQADDRRSIEFELEDDDTPNPGVSDLLDHTPPVIHDPVIDESLHMANEKAEEPVVPHVDFIDDRDSWVVDMEEYFGGSYFYMKSDLARLAALGLGFEFRVWRK